MSAQELSRACAEVLEILSRRHGIGVRGKRIPSWVELRLARALERMQRDDGGSLPELLVRLERDAGRLSRLADLLRVGETFFYRDPQQWEALRGEFLPNWRGMVARAASIGCSTGEEAWTLAMLLDEACSQRAGASYRVLGLDRSAAAVESAELGAYPVVSARHVPADLAKRYLAREADLVRVTRTLRERVSFVCRDLMTGLPPGEFDIVICKNVLLYFADDAGEKVLKTLFRALSPAGILLVARSEIPRLRALGFSARELSSGVTVFSP